MEEDIYEGVKNNDRNLLEELFEVRSKLFYTHLFNVCDFFMNNNENEELESIYLLNYIQQECIPVGCVQSATVAVCFRGGVSTPPPPGAGTPPGPGTPPGDLLQGMLR